MNEPICPKCGHHVNWWETVDESSDAYSYKIMCAGSCSHCGTNYDWWTVYKFSHIEELEEVK